MPNKCCVPHCKGNYQTGPQVSAFSFPNDEDLRARWLRAIRRADFTPTRQTKVCELHFAPEDIIRSSTFTDDSGKHQNYKLDRPRLMSGAVPYIMPNKRSFIPNTAPPRKDPHSKKAKVDTAASAAGMKEEQRRQTIVLITYRDTEQLISEVKKRPSIWDPTDDNYRNKIKKIEVWEEICRTFCPDYDQKLPAEKNLLEKELQGRWKSIRDSYSKNKRKITPGPGTAKIRQYIYAPQLSFLNKVNIPRKVAAPLPSDPGAMEMGEDADPGGMEVGEDATSSIGTTKPQPCLAKTQTSSAQDLAPSALVEVHLAQEHAHSALAEALSAQEHIHPVQEQTRPTQEQTHLAQELTRSAQEHTLSTKAQPRSAKTQRRSAQKQTRSAHGQTLSAKAQTRLAKVQAQSAQEQTRSTQEQTYSAQEQTHSAQELTHFAQEQTHSAQERLSTKEQAHAAEEQTRSAQKQTPTASQPQIRSEANKEKTISLEERLIQFMEGHEEEQDEDKDFLMSMLPSLKTLNQEQKIEFRIQTLNVFRNIKFGHAAHTQLHEYRSSTSIFPSDQHQYTQFPPDYSRAMTHTHDPLAPSSPTSYSPFDIEVKQQADFGSDSTEGNM